MIGKSVILFAVLCLAASPAQSCGCTILAKRFMIAPICDGPQTTQLPVLQAPSITLPAIETPILTLSSPPVPAPRVIAQKCICTKTVVKPQIIQREIKIPKIHRYLKRSYTPIIENVAYKTRPACCCCQRGNSYFPSSVC